MLSRTVFFCYNNGMENIAVLLTINVILLSVITGVALLVLILVLLMLRKTLIKVQQAVDEVQDAAMVPLNSIQHIFSDLEHFIAAFANMFRLLGKRRRKLE